MHLQIITDNSIDIPTSKVCLNNDNAFADAAAEVHAAVAEERRALAAARARDAYQRLQRQQGD
eukprot:4481254-Pyramimonas_sp.AAC.1